MGVEREKENWTSTLDPHEPEEIHWNVWGEIINLLVGILFVNLIDLDFLLCFHQSINWVPTLISFHGNFSHYTNTNSNSNLTNLFMRIVYLISPIFPYLSWKTRKLILKWNEYQDSPSAHVFPPCSSRSLVYTAPSTYILPNKNSPVLAESSIPGTNNSTQLKHLIYVSFHQIHSH